VEGLKERDHSEDPEIIWEDNIKMDFKGIVWVVVDWIDLAQDRDWYWAVENTGNEHSGSINI
jgi:hypothetical protein